MSRHILIFIPNQAFNFLGWVFFFIAQLYIWVLDVDLLTNWYLIALFLGELLKKSLDW